MCHPDSLITLAVADFNGDSHLDLAMTGLFGVTIWLGQGDGTFQAGPIYDVGTGWVAVGDFNRDGQVDLAVTQVEGANAVSISLGRGDGTFQAARGYPSGYPSGFGYAASVAVGDFNGDGIPDFAVAENEAEGGSVVLWLGNGDGSFRNAGSIPVARGPAGGGPIALAVADFNGDGKQDLLLCNYFPGSPRPPQGRSSGLRVFLGDGAGGFAEAFAYDSALGSYAVAIGDFNGDGIQDFVVANYGWISQPSHTLTVFLGKGDGTFEHISSYLVLAAPNSVAVADFNGDGKLDLAVAAEAGVSVLLGNGDGTFQAAQHYPVGPVVNLAVADFNGDGFLDLAVWQAGAAATAPGTVLLLLGQGDGNFQPGASYPAGTAPIYTVTYTVGLTAGDFNGDGFPDLAVTDLAAGSVSVLLGKGDGTFAPAQNFLAGAPSSSLAVADLNGDGNLDLAVASLSTVTILINDGNWPP